MALIECSDVALAPVDERLLWGHYVDYPAGGSASEAASFQIGGWVLGRRSPAAAIEILHHERLIRRVPVDVLRRDVAQAYPTAPGAQASGFSTVLRMSLADVPRQLLLRAVLEDQTRVPIATLRLRTRWRHEDHSAPLVSVVIPCYRQSQYLAEAIESVLGQTYPHVEVVVVDDGSPDNTGEVAARYPGVRYVRQPNLGVSEARNTGIRTSNGAFLIFLDADDRLLPKAIQTQLACFASHSEVAFVSGRLRTVAAGGTVLHERQGLHVTEDHYAHMLRRNYVPAPAAVMCRREVFERVPGFSSSFSVVADYDFYLRVLHEFAAWSHGEEVAEYRRHGLGLSGDGAQMLREALAALGAQWPHVRCDPALRSAYREGVRFWKTLAAGALVRGVRADWADGQRGAALWGLARLGRLGWFGALMFARRWRRGMLS